MIRVVVSLYPRNLRNLTVILLLLLCSFSAILPILASVGFQGISSYGKVKYNAFIKVIQQLNGTWLFIDGDGELFYSLGVTAVRYDNRPYYKENVTAKYGSLDTWGIATVERLKSWGFNTLGCWSQNEVIHEGLPHTTIVDIGMYAHNHGILLNRFNVPDVFDPRWSTLADQAARSLITSNQVNDEFLIGYFIANDFFIARWSPVQSDEHNEAMLKDDIDKLLVDQVDTDPAKARLIALNYDYHEWLTEYAELYYKTVCDAIRSVDPNHLILGSRGLSIYLPEEDLKGQKYCDVVSINFYEYLQYPLDFQEATIRQLQNYYNWSGRPIIIGEWSVRSKECDLDVTNVVGIGPIVDTQNQRGEYYNKTLSDISCLHFVVGMHWFMWTDKMVGGENSNYGLVNVNDDPYSFISDVYASNMAVLSARTFS